MPVIQLLSTAETRDRPASAKGSGVAWGTDRWVAETGNAAMFTLSSPDGFQHCDGLTRREVLRVGALGFGGLTLPGLLRSHEAEAGADRPARSPRARSVVILFLSGGPSQLDMWDL